MHATGTNGVLLFQASFKSYKLAFHFHVVISHVPTYLCKVITTSSTHVTWSCLNFNSKVPEPRHTQKWIMTLFLNSAVGHTLCPHLGVTVSDLRSSPAHSQEYRHVGHPLSLHVASGLVLARHGQIHRLPGPVLHCGTCQHFLPATLAPGRAVPRPGLPAPCACPGTLLGTSEESRRAVINLMHLSRSRGHTSVKTGLSVFTARLAPQARAQCQAHSQNGSASERVNVEG